MTPLTSTSGSSDIDSVGMFLAQSLVFFGEERLTLQAGRAHLWREREREKSHTQLR